MEFSVYKLILQLKTEGICMKKLFIALVLLLISGTSQAATLSLSNKLFNWAETEYPALLSPTGQTTQQYQEYLFRYYSNSNSYVATKDDGVYLYQPSVSPDIRYVGLISSFIDTSEEDSTTSNGSTTGSNTGSGTSTTASGKATPPSVVDCSSLGSTLGETAVQKLVAKGFDKCAMVFGFLVANSISNPSATSWTTYDSTYWTQLSANILAEILDNDQDGVADDSKVVGFMQTVAKGGWMPILSSALEEPSTYEDLNEIFGPDTAMKETWFKGSISETLNEDGTSSGGARAIIAQEAIHNWQTRGLAFAYPDVFGVPHTGCSDESNMSSKGCTFQDSILTRSTLEAMTTINPQWYGQYPSGNVYDASMGYNVGDCATPNCSAIEYYYNLLTAYKGSWTNDVGKDPYDFPANVSEVISKLNSTENGKALLQIIDNPSYHQLINGISFNYGGGASSSGSTSTSGNSGSSTGSSGSNSSESDNGGGTDSNENDNTEDNNHGPEDENPDNENPEAENPEDENSGDEEEMN